MNSFRCQSMLKDKSKLLAAVAIIVVAGASSAFAQQQMVLPPASVPANTMAPRPATPPGAPNMATPGQLSDAQTLNGQAPAADVKLPVGASVSDADQKVRDLAAEAGRKLDDLVGNTLDDKREHNDVATMSQRQIKLMDVDYQLQLAKKSKELWTTLNGDDNKKEEQIKSMQTKIDELNSVNAALKQHSEQLAAQVPQPGSTDPDPVVASIEGAGGKMEAKILVPYVGEIAAHPGDTLPNGQKIVSIAASGVTVSRDGKSKVLAFGTAVPSVRPQRTVIPAGTTVFAQ